MNCTRAYNSFRVEEACNWRDDVMEITRRIVHETDEARLSNIADHFEVDLSEIRSFLEMKQQQQRRPQTNADRIRSMTDEELAEWFGKIQYDTAYYCDGKKQKYPFPDAWLEWLKQECET